MITLLLKQHRFRPCFLFFLAFILIISFSFPSINAQEESKPKVEDWQLNGILAALDDPYPEVQNAAFEKLSEYDWQDYSPEKLEDIAKKAAKVFNNKQANSFVRSSAAIALSNFEDAGKFYVTDIADILKDEQANSFVRSSAAAALGNLGDAAEPYIKDLVNILNDGEVNSDIRSSAAEALGNFGDAAKPYTKYLVDILKDENLEAYVRSSAAQALGKLRKPDSDYLQYILDFLQNKEVNPYIRHNTASALANFEEVAKPYAEEQVRILKSKEANLQTRTNAAEALSNLGDAAKPYVKDFVYILKSDSLNSYYSSSLAEALGNFGKYVDNDDYVSDIVDILNDKKANSLARSSAAIALSNIEDRAEFYAGDFANILKDKGNDPFIRSNAARALGNLGKYLDDDYVNDILNFLKDEQDYPRHYQDEAAQTLEKITEKLELDKLVTVLNHAYYYIYESYNFIRWRFQAYFLGGGTEKVKTLLTWLVNEDEKGIPKTLKSEKGREILELFEETWKYSEGLKPLRKDLADKIADVAEITTWTPWHVGDMQLLQRHSKNLKDDYPGNALRVQSAIKKFTYWQWFSNSAVAILSHITFWLALIFAYPKSPQIQAIFFWNPWVRKIIGVGYVDFFLTWIPFLHRKLFEPFQFSLLADAELDEFSAPAYFPNSCVKKKLGERQPITQAIPAIKGEIVLEGNSGLGKSMFLRHLLHTSRRIVVYLPARKCDKGVIAAIQAKLHGQAKDEAFLKNLIYSGAIDICIDGLNEVTADTRAQIRQFVESYFRGNIIMTTQPLEWEPPSTATTYYLQPLAKEQIEEFLLSRQSYLSPDATIQGDNYRDACVDYLNKILDDSQSPEELTAAQNILSNPMDLTVVSQMLSHDKQPELFRLVEQQYNLMAEEYQENWNQPFPLEKFSQAVYKMRIKDESILPTEKFYNELIAMEDEKYKMVVSRQWQDNKGKSKQQWCFRHDKIMDFFLVQTFLGDSEQVQTKLIDHMGDPRFRGVYFLLANLLSPEDALSLREELIQYAADTRDHTVSDTFVTLLRTRPQLQM